MKTKKLKTRETKIKETKEIITKLTELKINPSFDGVKDMFVKFKEYIDGEHSFSGKIPIKELNREIEYNFPQTEGKDIYLKLRYKEYDSN